MLLNIIVALISLALGVIANTEIINAGPLYCPLNSDATLRSSLEISQSWPKLRLSSSPTLFSIVPDWDQRARVVTATTSAGEQSSSSSTLVAPRADEGYWIALHLSAMPSRSTERNSKQDKEPSLVQRIQWWLTKRFTIRVSWPANHPLDLHLTLHTPESMLRVGGRSVGDEEEGQQREQQMDSVESDKRTSLCSVLYLHLYATSHGVKIPPAKKQGRRDLSTRTRWLLDVAEKYMSPLYAGGQVEDGEQSVEPGPTPIHVSFEPLVLGVLPQALAVSAVTLGGYVLVGWIALSTLGLAPQTSPIQAAVHLLQRVYEREST